MSNDKERSQQRPWGVGLYEALGSGGAVLNDAYYKIRFSTQGEAIAWCDEQNTQIDTAARKWKPRKRYYYEDNS